MARPTLQQMMSVLDPLQAWGWSLSIPRVPGVADSRQLTYRAVSTSIPGTALEQVTWEAHGMKLRYAGKRSWDDTWEFQVIEARDCQTRDILLAWMDSARSWRGNDGGYKQDYSVPCVVELLDDKPSSVRELKMVNAFPTQVGQVTMDQSSTIVQYSVTLSFDTIEEVIPS